MMPKRRQKNDSLSRRATRAAGSIFKRVDAYMMGSTELRRADADAVKAVTMAMKDRRIFCARTITGFYTMHMLVGTVLVDLAESAGNLAIAGSSAGRNEITVPAQLPERELARAHHVRVNRGNLINLRTTKSAGMVWKKTWWTLSVSRSTQDVPGTNAHTSRTSVTSATALSIKFNSMIVAMNAYHSRTKRFIIPSACRQLSQSGTTGKSVSNTEPNNMGK
ncbi:hypothetical protein EV424DRAFT_1351728 [Suillus variegatus]|nr:hypothetical protein EV424DRAFT_1351728 [Suillus variegatus]